MIKINSLNLNPRTVNPVKNLSRKNLLLSTLLVTSMAAKAGVNNASNTPSNSNANIATTEETISSSKTNDDFQKNLPWVGLSVLLLGTLTAASIKQEKLYNEMKRDSEVTGMPLDIVEQKYAYEKKVKNSTLSNLSPHNDNNYIMADLGISADELRTCEKNGWKVFTEEDNKTLHNLEKQIKACINDKKIVPQELKEQFDEIYNNKRLCKYI